MKRYLGRFLIFGILLVGLAQTQAVAQSVRDSAFCLSVVNNRCVDLVPNGASISLQALPLVDGYPTIYFWGNLRNPSQNGIAFAFSREGACYENEALLPDNKAFEELTFFQELAGGFMSITVAELWRYLGLTSAEVGNAGIRVSGVMVPEANQYNVFTFRHAHCPGRFKARLIGSNGSPLPGANDVDIVLVR